MAFSITELPVFVIQFQEMEVEQHERSRLADIIRKLRGMHTLDILALCVLAALFIGAGAVWLHHQALNHELASAQEVTDQVIAAMAKQDTAAVVKLGTKQFQQQNTAKSLSDHLTATDTDGTKITFAQLYGDVKPHIDQRIVKNSAAGQYVAVEYKYTKLKVAFYVRVDVLKTPGAKAWHLTALNTTQDETTDSAQPASTQSI